MCTIAAPALAASTADWAICCGVTGTAGFRPGVSADPVTAQEIMTLRCIGASPGRHLKPATGGAANRSEQTDQSAIGFDSENDSALCGTRDLACVFCAS